MKRPRAPFEKKFRVTVRQETWSGDFNQLKAMVENGEVAWDVVDVESFMVPLGAAQNLFEELDDALVPKAELLDEAWHPNGVAICFWSTVLAYSTSSHDGRHPSGWRDFWDAKTFPGPRALRNEPAANLEIALLADGVAPADLYPLDVARALKSLDRIRNEIAVWWKTGEEPIDLIAGGQVQMTSAWNGRVHAAIDEGKPIDFDWEQAILNSDWWVIPRGAENRKSAQEFVAFASSVPAQSELPRYIPYGPVNTRALENIPEQLRRSLPSSPENMRRQIHIDHDWWNENHERVTREWDAWWSRTTQSQ